MPTRTPNYTLLGMIAELAGDATLGDLLHERAFAGMVASPSDLAQWITALYAGDVLNEESTALLVQDPVPMGGGLSYGLGTVIVPASATVGPAQPTVTPAAFLDTLRSHSTFQTRN